MEDFDDDKKLKCRGCLRSVWKDFVEGFIDVEI